MFDFANTDYKLCDTDFFDVNRTWYTEEPEFSSCFRNTLLSWIPACAFILTATHEYASIKRMSWTKKPIAPNWFNRPRLLVVFSLILVTFFKLVYIYATTLQDDPATSSGVLHESSALVRGATSGGGGGGPSTLVISTVLAPLLQLIAYTGLLFIYMGQRSVGRHTSGPVWFYHLLAICCNFIDYYAVITESGGSLPSKPLELCYRLLEYAHLPLLVLLFVLECRGDTLAPEPNPSGIRPPCPELGASYCSSIIFWWYNRDLMHGYKFRLRFIDLWATQAREQSGLLVPQFRETWVKTARMKKGKQTYQLASGDTQPDNSVLKILRVMFWRPLLLAASLKLIQDSLQYLTPMILKRILAFMSAKNTEPFWHGVLFALLLLIVPSIQSIFLCNYFYRMQLIGLHIRSMIIGAVYRKALVLSGSSRLQSTSGEIVNLMAVDSHRFQDLVMYINLFWSAPFQIVLAIYLLYRELGWSVFAGVICMALVIPANAYLANRVKFAQVKVMKTKDERIKQMNELLGGIKVIKLYAWENSFIANLFRFRNKELSNLSRQLTLDALLTFLWTCSPFVVACVTFAVYVSSDPANVLNAEKAFVSISLFNLLRFPLSMLPSLVTSLVLTMVSAKRLNKFLNRDELIQYVTRNEELEAISIEGGALTWAHDADSGTANNGATNSAANGTATNKDTPTRDPQRAILRDIDLHVRAGSFVAIVGQVASGKSSLLAAILNEMHRITGRFNVCKSMSMAYVPQQAWIQNMTVRDNILFGSAYDEQRYKQVLDACSLRADLESLAGGDQAEIGEKGINLSGGQKQRVSLARACYSNSDILLLDDPLSALDSHVSKHVFDEVLSSSTGLLKGRTRVLATNSLFVLPHVDHVVVLDDGKVVESGSYRQLMGNDRGHLAEFMRQYLMNQRDEDEVKLDLATVEPVGEQLLAKADEQLVPAGKRLLSPTLADESKGLESKGPQPPAPTAADLGKLIDVEKVELGSVNFRVYLKYFKSVSIGWISAVAVSLVASSAFNVATNLWLSLWASDADDPSKAQDADLKTIRLVVYASFGGLQCFAILGGSLFLCRGAIRAARQLHGNLLERVLHSPMGFFDTTPIGRIVNRFAKDIDVVDTTLPGTFRSWFNCLLQVLSTLFVICYSFPTFLIILIPLGFVYYLIQKVFIVTTRQLKRMESTTRSPIYSNFSETLSGASTIRAYECADRFVRYSDNLVDRNLACSYPNIIANRWLSVRLEFFGNLITSLAALFSVYYMNSIAAGVAGLTISYSLNITQTLSWLVRMTSDLETHIVSVERILEYMNNKQEDRWIKDEHRPASDWPQAGAIELRQYSTRYRNDTDLVLRDLSISIRPREKVGIVGRTGSGKSSLSLALFRILEPAKGCIQIDGRSLTDFGLHDIRSRLTIIPQDPVLFSGSLRFNLDPLQLYPDGDIWRALELAHLKPYISSLELGLDHKVSEFGENFSLGQRQLICLARAILRKSRILILDEATASVDLETDSIVQRAIREIFDDCTIITIAHRLHTILNSDRILVLASGEVRELDSPANLLADPSSAFSSLVRDAGIDTSGVLAQRRAT